MPNNFQPFSAKLNIKGQWCDRGLFQTFAETGVQDSGNSNLRTVWEFWQPFVDLLVFIKQHHSKPCSLARRVFLTDKHLPALLQCCSLASWLDFENSIPKVQFMKEDSFYFLALCEQNPLPSFTPKLSMGVLSCLTVLHSTVSKYLLEICLFPPSVCLKYHGHHSE